MINLSSDNIINVDNICSLFGVHIHALSLRINLSFRINTIFIGIFYGFIIKNCFWKAHITGNAICRKIKVRDLCIEIIFILEPS